VVDSRQLDSYGRAPLALRGDSCRPLAAELRTARPSVSVASAGPVTHEAASLIFANVAKPPARAHVLPEHRTGDNAGMTAIVGKLARGFEADSAQLPDVAAPRRMTGGASDHATRAMERYARGDESAFASLYDAVAPRIHAYLLRQTRDRAIADDLLQLTLLQMHKKRGMYATGLPVLPWAFAIARRLYIDECRRRKTDALWSARDVGEDDGLAWTRPDDEVASRETVQLIEAELARMPSNQRVAFELLKVDGLSHQDAARLLGTTVSAVKLRAFRAYSAIRAVLRRPLEPTAFGKRRRGA